jgi:Uma2 family endonuclease
LPTQVEGFQRLETLQTAPETTPPSIGSSVATGDARKGVRYAEGSERFVAAARPRLAMTTLPDVLSVTSRADHVPGPRQGSWTYEDYAALPDDGNRYEIIDGVLYLSPAPNILHQIVVTTIAAYLKLHVEFVGLGRVLAAPTDVELAPRDSPLQPDVIVVLNDNLRILESKTRIVGAPDLVVEVASPSTATYDRREKLDAYARAGVREYWLVDPYAQTVEVLYLEGGAFISAGAFHGGALLPSRVVPEFPVRVEQCFA